MIDYSQYGIRTINGVDFARKIGGLIGNLVAYYTFDGAAGDDEVDAHGNAGDLAQTGSPPSVAGLLGNARDMDITTPSYFTAAAPHNLGLDGSFTITFWIYIKTLAAQAGDYQDILYCRGGWPPKGYDCKLAFNQLAFTVLGGISNTAVTHADVKGEDAGWTFVAFVHDNDAKTIYSYDDGISPFAFTASDTYIWDYLAPYVTEVAKVGTENSVSSQGRFYLDSLAVFDRALAFTELEWIYNSGSGRTYAEYT